MWDDMFKQVYGDSDYPEHVCKSCIDRYNLEYKPKVLALQEQIDKIDDQIEELRNEFKGQ